MPKSSDLAWIIGCAGILWTLDTSATDHPSGGLAPPQCNMWSSIKYMEWHSMVDICWARDLLNDIHNVFMSAHTCHERIFQIAIFILSYPIRLLYQTISYTIPTMHVCSQNTMRSRKPHVFSMDDSCS
jgi:hypothetical protein